MFQYTPLSQVLSIRQVPTNPLHRKPLHFAAAAKHGTDHEGRVWKQSPS